MSMKRMNDDGKKKDRLISGFGAGFMLGNWATAFAYMLIRFVIRIIGD